MAVSTNRENELKLFVSANCTNDLSAAQQLGLCYSNIEVQSSTYAKYLDIRQDVSGNSDSLREGIEYIAPVSD